MTKPMMKEPIVTKKNIEAMRARAAELAPLCDEARNLRNAIEEYDDDEKAPALIGKCFRFLNSYGVGDPSPRWYVYRKIVGLGKKYGVRVIDVQDDKRGRVSVEAQDLPVYHFRNDGGWQPVPSRDFDAAARRVLNAAANEID